VGVRTLSEPVRASLGLGASPSMEEKSLKNFGDSIAPPAEESTDIPLDSNNTLIQMGDKPIAQLANISFPQVRASSTPVRLESGYTYFTANAVPCTMHPHIAEP
jgi:hypothetical protein